MKTMIFFDGPVEIAFDGHKITRNDKQQRPELLNSKSKNKIGQFESYVTAQCITKGQKITLGVIPHLKLETVSNIMLKLVQICKNVRIEIGMIMLDREFFTAQTIQHMTKNNIPFLIPCKNTNVTINAMHEYAKGNRERVPKLTIRSENGKYEFTYTAIITKRTGKIKKKSKKTSPEE